MEVDEDEEEAVKEYTEYLVDGWHKVAMPGFLFSRLVVLRTRLGECFAAKVAKPDRPLCARHAALLDTLADVFTAEVEGYKLSGLLTASNPITSVGR